MAMSTMSISEPGRRAVVIGLGNPLMGDDGLGLAALEQLRAQWRLAPGVDTVRRISDSPNNPIIAGMKLIP